MINTETVTTDLRPPKKPLKLGKYFRKVATNYDDIIGFKDGFLSTDGRYTSLMMMGSFKDSDHWANGAMAMTLFCCFLGVQIVTFISHGKKNKASVPDFIENIDGIPTDAACGYLYIFVDGYLWREVACIGNGMYSDVDLMQEHSKDFRKHYSSPTLNIIIPTKTKALYNVVTDQLLSTTVEIAFSRVQWSWQYINDLGGMFVSDQRFAKTPLLSKCIDRGRGELLRGQRCQKFDFTQQESPRACEYIYANNIVYLHDMIGIAQRYYVHLDEMVFRMQGHFQSAKQQPYYDSALLACQMFLNDKLQQTRTVATNYWQRTEYIDKSSEASTLRKVASKLSPEAIEKLLITPEEITLLEQYLALREELANFLNHEYDDGSEVLTLTEICEITQIHLAPDWHIAMRDLSTLSIHNYHNGQNAAYDILNSVTKPMRQLPIFIQGMVTKASKEKRQLLTEYMAELNVKTKELNDRLSFEAGSWLRQQFCANVNAFGTDMKNGVAELVDPENEPGIFDPLKFKAAVTNANEGHAGVGALYVLAIKSTKTGGTVVDGMLRYWKNTIDLSNSPNLQKITFQVVGTTLKSSGLDTFKDVTFAKFGAIPDTHVIIGGNVKTHNLFDHLSDAAKRRADYALNHVTEAYTQGKEPQNKYLRELEKYVSKGTHTSKSAQRNVIIADRKTGATIGVSANAGVTALVQKHLDALGSLNELKRLEIDVLMVPRSALPAGIAHKFDDANPLRGNQGFNLDKMSSYTQKFQRGLPGTIFLLDGMLAAYAYYNYQTEFKGKGSKYERLKHVAYIAELTVSAATVFEAYISNQTKMSQALFVKGVAKVNPYLSVFKMEMKITRLTIAAGLTGIIGAGVGAWDAWILLQKNDKDAAIAGFISAGTAGAASAMAMLSLAGPIFWGLIIASLVFSAISSILVNSDMDNWAEFGPFGQDKANRLKGFSAFANDRAYHNYILSLLFSPTVNIKATGGEGNFIITINVPLYGDFDTDAYLDVEAIHKIKIAPKRHIYKAINVPINHTFVDENIKHKIAEPIEVRNSKGIVERFEYQAYFDLTKVTKIKVKAAIMKDNIYYPQDIEGYKDQDPDEIGSLCYDIETVNQTLNQTSGKVHWANDEWVS